MSEPDRQKALEELIEAWRGNASDAFEYYVEKMRDLAEASYEPAGEFFMSCLDDPRWNWRYHGLCNLGFHYVFPSDSPIVMKIQGLLLTDPHSTVREAAASILGSRSRWPDEALISTLESDGDEQVRFATFAALLRLAGVPIAIVTHEIEQVQAGNIQPTLLEVERILAETGFGHA